MPWIVVFAHKPLYCSTGRLITTVQKLTVLVDDYYDCKVGGPKVIAPEIEPLLKENNVDLFLAGHLHNYERRFLFFH